MNSHNQVRGDMEVPIPPLPNEVISEILSNLGINDLLKCRLVNQTWKELSLKILRNPKYEYYHELTQNTIQKFIEFSNGRTEEWILPFYLNFRRRESRDEESEEDKEFIFCFIVKIPSYIRQLQAIFGEKCVSGLALSHESYVPFQSVSVLFYILTAIAPSITHLDLSDFKLNYQGEHDIMPTKEMLGKTELNFSNLSSLMSCPPPIVLHEDNRLEKRENDLHSFLIEKSKNLKELEVISPLDLSVLQNQIEGLRKLKIVDTLEHLDDFALPTLPVLKDLWLTYCSGLLQHQLLIDFLSSFSTSLQSLMIDFEQIPKNPFPRLSHLKYLGIRIPTHIRDIVPLEMEKLNLNSEAFPVLESMDLPLNVYLMSTAGNSKDDWSLRTVKNLIIGVIDFPFNDQVEGPDQYKDEDEPSAKEYVDRLQEVFPNVTSLTLVNETDGHEEYLNQFLIEVIQSEGSARIQELEIYNCEYNYLGHILNGLDTECQPRIIIENMNMDEKLLKCMKEAFQGFCGGSQLSVNKQLEFKDGDENRLITCKVSSPSNIHLTMTGLKKIKIHTSYSTKHNDNSGQLGIEIEGESNQKDLFLMSLPKHFPLLRQIDISQQMFGDDKEICKQQIINVQNRFPDLIINTIN